MAAVVAVLQVAAMEVVVEETLEVQVVEEVVVIDQVEEILEEAEVMEGEVGAAEATVLVDPGRSSRTIDQRKTIATSRNNQKDQTRTTDSRTTGQGQTIRTGRDLNNRDLKAKTMEITSRIITGTTSTTTMPCRNPMSGALQLCSA